MPIAKNETPPDVPAKMFGVIPTGDKSMRSKMISVLTLTIVAGLLVITPVQGQRGGQQIQLPAGPGQEVVQARCTQCHGLNLITTSAGFSRNEWAALAATMVALPPNESAALSTYLAA